MGGQIDPWPQEIRGNWEAELRNAEQVRLKSSAYARSVDPKGRLAYWTDYSTLVSIYAPQLKSLLETNLTGFPRQKTQQDLIGTYKSAAAYLDAYVPTDPNNAQLHFLLADAYFMAGDKAKSREQAVKAQELDEKETTGRRKLTDKQREQVRLWLSEKAGG
jgi:Flp pilus assembly protein TadD